MPPLSAADVEPAAAVSVPPQVVAAFAGVATRNWTLPETGRVSDTDTLFSGLAEKLLKVMVMRVTVPSWSGPAGLNALAATSVAVLTAALPDVAPPPLQSPAPLSVQTWPAGRLFTVELPLVAPVATMA